MTILFLILFGVGGLFRILQPKKINYLYGHRTRKSMKSNKHWKVANKFLANLMMFFMSILLWTSFIFDIFHLDFESLLMGLLLASFVIIIFLTETRISKI